MASVSRLGSRTARGNLDRATRVSAARAGPLESASQAPPSTGYEDDAALGPRWPRICAAALPGSGLAGYSRVMVSSRLSTKLAIIV